MRYEYFLLVLSGNDQEELNHLGAQGWRLIAVTTESEDRFSVAYLMREILPDAGGSHA